MMVDAGMQDNDDSDKSYQLLRDAKIARIKGWSPEERATARRIVVALHERMSSAVASGHEATVVPPDVRRRWRWLTTAWH